DASLAAARLARLLDDVSVAAAHRAGPRDHQEALLEALASAAAAARARLRPRPGLGARSPAILAALQARDRDRRFHSEGRVAEGDLHPVYEVAARHRPMRSPAESGPGRESEDPVEQVRKVSKSRGIEPGKSAEAGARAHAGMPEPVVPRPLLGVAENRIGLGRLLEPLGGLGIVRVAVRVVGQRELSVRGLQLSVARIARDSEDFV